MIRKSLRYVREQPKNIRNRYALLGASVFTGIVALLYLVTGALTSPFPNQSATVENAGAAPFSTFMKQIKEQWSAAKEGAATTTSIADDEETVMASTTDPREMILTPENKLETELVATSSFSTTTKDKPREVQIVTIRSTSSASSTSSSTTSQ